MEGGEKLYPTTSTDGREVIRGELRVLRDDWDNYSDGLAGVQRRLEATLANWEAYEESKGALEKWLIDTELRLETEAGLKSTLPEKKGAVNKYRVSGGYLCTLSRISVQGIICIHCLTNSSRGNTG